MATTTGNRSGPLNGVADVSGADVEPAWPHSRIAAYYMPYPKDATLQPAAWVHAMYTIRSTLGGDAYWARKGVPRRHTTKTGAFRVCSSMRWGVFYFSVYETMT